MNAATAPVKTLGSNFIPRFFMIMLLIKPTMAPITSNENIDKTLMTVVLTF